MTKEHFFYPETQPLFKALESLRQRSSISRGQAFEDWLTAMVCALAAETKEEEYLTMAARHKQGKKGQRGIDLMGEMFGQLVQSMENTDADILGDLFQSAITHGENGLYLTPNAITELMARLTIDPDAHAHPETGDPLLINDPCCGTGRMLLAASKVNPQAELVGQDIDARCARITAINLGLRGKYGWVICGNSLSGKIQFAYRIGHFFHESPQGLRRGIIRDVPPDTLPVFAIAEQASGQTCDLFSERGETEATTASVNPIIVEVPHWLARLERTLAAAEVEQPTSAPQPSNQPRNLPESADQPPKQQLLF